MAQEKIAILRPKLLSVNGIGQETADSILLYALNKPVFVVDTYTRRIFSRHELLKEDCSYQGMKSLFQESLTRNVHLFNEYHALIVQLGKEFCRPRPACDRCPLNHLKKEAGL